MKRTSKPQASPIRLLSGVLFDICVSSHYDWLILLPILSIITTMSHSVKKSGNEVRIMQFNQMKGVREGRKDEVREESEGVVISGQLGVKLPGEYMVAVVENGAIVEWRKAEMLDMRCTGIK